MTATIECPSTEKLSELVKQRAPTAEGERLLQHLEHCPHCWETIAPLMESDTLLDGVSLTPGDVSPQFVRQLLALQFPEELLAAGTVIGPYRIESLLGRGGMGAVYLALDTRLQRKIALKVMLPKYAANPVARERFLREARAAARIAQDNVVTVYEADEYAGVPVIAMPLLHGLTLEDALKRGTVFSEAQMLRMAEEIARGLAAAHSIGLVHRDIKPGNLWLEEPGGRVKVLDFGLAKPLDAASELTLNGSLVGTPAFMAPEQARGGQVDHRADLFSLGVVLYRLAAGRVPFDGPTTMAMLMALASDEAERVCNVSPGLAALIHDLLAKNPDGRPQTADDVLRRLQTLQAPPRGARPWHTAGFAAMLAVIVGGTVIIIRNKDGSEKKIEVPDGSAVIVQEQGKTVAVAGGLTDAAWEKEVAGMTAANQTKAVAARLKMRNPKFDESKVEFRIEKDRVVDLVLRDASELTDLGPIHALAELKSLHVDGRNQNPGSIGPLKGMKLTEVSFNACPLKDLSALADLPLQRCGLWGMQTTDLSALKGKKLIQANVGLSDVKDLSVFRGMPLDEFCINLSQVEDISPLKGSPLKTLMLANTKVTDLTPIIGMPIEWLCINGSPIKDYSPLKNLPLVKLEIDYDAKLHRELLRGIPTLKLINLKPAAAVLETP